MSSARDDRTLRTIPVGKRDRHVSQLMVDILTVGASRFGGGCFRARAGGRLPVPVWQQVFSAHRVEVLTMSVAVSVSPRDSTPSWQHCGNGPSRARAPGESPLFEPQIPAGGNLVERPNKQAYVPPAESRPQWERLPGEITRAYHAFCHYRDLPQGGRSGRLAYITHKKNCDQVSVDPTHAPQHWSVWRTSWNWIERAAQFDDDVERQHRSKVVKQQLEARERHARLASATLSAMSIPVRAFLQANVSPVMHDELVAHVTDGGVGAKLQLLATIARVAQSMPMMVNVERLALGLTTQSIEVDNKRDEHDLLANQIAADPEATSLAVALLARVAQKNTPVIAVVDPMLPFVIVHEE